VLARALRQHHAALTDADHDDALAALLEAAWIAWQRYDACRGATFRTYLNATLERRVIDYWRSRFGRTGGPRAAIKWESLDELADAGKLDDLEVTAA
jgi:DNA-directed RNA polymerase specialized sigma24 family protein